MITSQKRHRLSVGTLLLVNFLLVVSLTKINFDETPIVWQAEKEGKYANACSLYSPGCVSYLEGETALLYLHCLRYFQGLNASFTPAARATGPYGKFFGKTALVEFFFGIIFFEWKRN